MERTKHGSDKEKHEDTRTISFRTLLIFLSEIVLLPPPSKHLTPMQEVFYKQ
jgi:hypothetical protein